MGHIVDKCMSENVKVDFGNLKEKIQRQGAIPPRQENSYGFRPNLDSNSGIIQVPATIRRMLMETFEKLGWSDAEYFLQTLGDI